MVALHVLSCPRPWGILVPGPDVEPVTPALAGGFLITGLPGKSLPYISYVCGG